MQGTDKVTKNSTLDVPKQTDLSKPVSSAAKEGERKKGQPHGRYLLPENAYYSKRINNLRDKNKMVLRQRFSNYSHLYATKVKKKKEEKERDVWRRHSRR